MTKIMNKEHCCGCNVCGDTCHAKAIQFIRDDGGFLYPQINKNLCTECGRCEQICPHNAIKNIKSTFEHKKTSAYAAVAKDLSIRFDSTSGGLFSIFANSVFAEHGYVGGAIWDDEFLVHHIITDNVNDLPRLRSSKYAQSDARGFYTAVQKTLESGKKVLVCGLPCQMIALRAFLDKDYDNLIIVDLVCRSVSSPYFLQKYIGMHEKKKSSKVVAIKQKDKGLGWRNLTTKLFFANGDILYDPKASSYFMRTFEANLISRPACYSCQFRGLPRIADITLADCWGAVDKIPKEQNLDNDIGTSLILCNTWKGQDFWNIIKKLSQVSYCDIDLADAISGNPGFLYSIPKPKADNSNMYRDLAERNLEDVMPPLLQECECSANSSKKYSRLRSCVRFFLQKMKRLRYFGWNLLTACRINGVKNVIASAPVLYPYGNVVFESEQDSSLEVNQTTYIGTSVFKKTKDESRLKLFSGAKLIINGGKIGHGCHIVLFENSVLEIGAQCCINVGFTISCGKSIKIGKNVFIGQNVTIRDTHGDHYINSPGYEPSKPIEIGEHVWICSNVMIMPGVKIGSGSIIAACSLVNRDVPSGVVVGGIPAKIIRENVQFRC